MKILDEMDVKAPQVVLSTVIGELRLNNDENFGVDYFLRGNDGRTNGAVIARNAGGLLPFASPGGSPGVDNTLPSSPGAIFNPAAGANFAQLASGLGTGLNVYLAAGIGFLRLSKPSNRPGASRRFRARWSSREQQESDHRLGQEIPVPVSTLSTNNGGGVVGGICATIEYPVQEGRAATGGGPADQFREGGVARYPAESSTASRASPRSITTDIPNIVTRYIKTTVSAPNCSTIVLGGLITDTRRRDVSGIPILGKFPWIGGLFRNTNKTK